MFSQFQFITHTHTRKMSDYVRVFVHSFQLSPFIFLDLLWKINFHVVHSVLLLVSLLAFSNSLNDFIHVICFINHLQIENDLLCVRQKPYRIAWTVAPEAYGSSNKEQVYHLKVSTRNTLTQDVKFSMLGAY